MAMVHRLLAAAACGLPGLGSTGTEGAFHSIVSARLPCVQSVQSACAPARLAIKRLRSTESPLPER